MNVLNCIISPFLNYHFLWVFHSFFPFFFFCVANGVSYGSFLALSSTFMGRRRRLHSSIQGVLRTTVRLGISFLLLERSHHQCCSPSQSSYHRHASGITFPVLRFFFFSANGSFISFCRDRSSSPVNRSFVDVIGGKSHGFSCYYFSFFSA